MNVFEKWFDQEAKSIPPSLRHQSKHPARRAYAAGLRHAAEQAWGECPGLAAAFERQADEIELESGG